MGLDVNYFYELTPRQFDNILRGYLKKENLKDRSSWEQTRYIMWIIANSNSTKKIELTKLMKFPWDDETGNSEQPKPTKEALKAMFEKWDQLEFKPQ